jgi:hypothetical protein
MENLEGIYHRIFRSEKLKERKKERIFNVHEAKQLGSKSGRENLQCDPKERPILHKWDLGLDTLPLQPLFCSPSSCSPDSWQRPPTCFHELNIYGASKGKPRLAGFGVIFRDNKGHICHFIVGSIGCDSNNFFEL